MVLVAKPLTPYAQDSHHVFEHLTTDQGLSSNKVEAIWQDKQGFYWIATQNGLNRFDGSSFRIYRNNPDESTTLSNNYCTALAEDRNGDIWISTYKGVSRFIKSKGIFQQLFLNNPSINFELSNRVYNLAIDHEGNIWMAGNGLWKYNIENDSLTFFQNNPAKKSSLPPHGLITQMVYDTVNNGLWISVGDKLVFFSSEKNEFYHKENNPAQWEVFEGADGAELTLDNKNRLWFRDRKTQSLGYFDIDKNQVTLTEKKMNYGIKQIRADHEGRIWLFYFQARAEIYEPESGTTDSDFFAIYHRSSMLSEQANSLFIDKQNNKWIASGNGISIYNEDNQYYKLHQLTVTSRGAENEPLKINALAQTKPDHIWVGTNIGLFDYNLITGAYQPFLITTPLNYITTMYADGELLWIGVRDQLLCFDTKKEAVVNKMILKSDIFFIRKDNQHGLWAGLWTGGLYHIQLQTHAIKYISTKSPTEEALKTNSLITGLQDGDNFWIGYNGGSGFSKYSMTDSKMVNYHPQEKNLSNSSAGTITAITKDDSGHLWLGTYGSGIFYFDPVTEQYTNYQQQEGLNSNFINSIVADENDNLWISTADGMNYFNTGNKKTIHHLDINLVFPENEFRANGISGLNGKLYFFCKNEFVEIDPMAYHPDPAFPKVVISGFKIFDKETAISDQQPTIHLTYKENFFTFEYSTIKTNPAKEINYAYKLEGFDKDWHQAGDLHYASYTDVPDGNFIFNVKATNDEGQWSDVLLSMPIHIEPPFWRTWWFITLCIVLIFSGIYAVYRFRIRQLNKLAILRSKISQDLHDEIGSALSSIHIYSSVASRAMDKNRDITKKALNHIYQNSRQVMDNMSDIVWAINRDKPGESTLGDKLKNYGYELLTPLNINVTYAIDNKAEEKLNHIEARKNILLIAKEAMNNIAKHSGATEATVRVELNHKNLLLKIEDNGKGLIATTGHHGNGLLNMRNRTEMMGGKFTCKSEENKGTFLTCSIPIARISNT